MIQESPQKLTIYRSSAGSGKTYTLVKEYLRLVLPSPYLYRNVLAVTFTNKATEEMKERILGKLYELSQASTEQLQSIGEYQDIKEELASHEPDPDAWVAKRARIILRSILGDYGHFSVSTIESFFQGILRAFARELDIPMGYEVEMKQAYVLDRLIEGMSLQIGEDKGLQDLLQEYLLQRLEEEKGWSVFQELQSLGKEVFKEVFVDQVKGPMDEVEDMLSLAKALSKKAWKRRRAFEAALKSEADKALTIMEGFGLSSDDFNRGTIPNYFKRVSQATKPADFDPTGTKTVMEGIADDTKWKKKSNKDRHPIIDSAMNAGMLSALQNMVEKYLEEGQGYFTDLLITRTGATFGLLGFLEQQLKEYRKENRLLLISDTSRLLTQVIRESDPPFVYEKAGHYYKHFLLDEFQDTSNLQWENFEPLIDESLAYGQFNLMVGDVKQAIYRWRNGNPQLMLNIEKSDPFRISKQTLSSNWRSSPEVVKFNNIVFETANHLLKEKLQEEELSPENQSLLNFFEEAYSDAAQQEQKQSPRGLVTIEFADPELKKVDEFRTAALDKTLEWIQECREAGFAYRDLAILVRNNKEGVAQARFLLDSSIVVNGVEEGISVSSAESLLLESHSHVRWLLAALRMIQTPDEPIAIMSWQDLDASISGINLADFKYEKEASIRIQGILPMIRNLPIYEAVEVLVRHLPATASRSNAYVLGFLEAVWEYSGKYDTSIAGFMEWWKEEKKKRSVKGSESDDSVTVMTIHQSKGLEFPVVMLPYADWELGIRSNIQPILWVETAGTAYEQDFPILPVYVGKDMQKSDFADSYQREQLLTHLDNLNLLYVALTRPMYRLYLFSPDSGVDKKQVPGYLKLNTVGHLLESLSKEGSIPGLQSEGVGRWRSGAKEAAPAQKHKKATSMLDDLGTYQPPKQRSEPLVHLRTTGWLESTEEGRESIREGLLVHEALAHINTSEDIGRVVEMMKLKGMLLTEQEMPLRDRLEKIITFKDAAHWFDTDWEIRSEVGILQADGREKRPDRVLTKGDKAIVIDFKTGSESSAHLKQVAEYQSLLQSMGYADVEGFVYYTGALKVVRV